MEVLKRIYIIRISAGIIAGFISGLLKVTGTDGVFIAIIIYAATHYGVRFLLKDAPERHYLIGLMEYIGLWLTIWSLIFTVFNFSSLSI